MLRESAQQSSRDVKLEGLIEGVLGDTGIDHADLLIAFAEAAVGDDTAVLDRTRARLLATLGAAALIDTAATVASFNSVVRVASATGIPLDAIDEANADNQDMFEKLGIDQLKK